MDSINFLEKHGTKANDVAEINQGDIVGRQNITGNCEKHTIRLYYVSEVILHAEPPFFATAPRIDLLPPHVGITIVDNKITAYYIHTPTGGEQYQYSWSHKTEEPDENFTLYKMHDTKCIALGNLIPKVTIPTWAFMCQNAKEENIFKFVEQVQEDIAIGRAAHKRIKNLAQTLSRNEK